MRLVLATPHHRYDTLELALREQGFELLRITDPSGLDPAVLAEWSPDWLFFPHWSWRISPAVFDAYRCVIFHMTNLPFGRGGSPLQNLVLKGYSETTLTALQCVEELDAGPIYLKRLLPLYGTADEILLRAANIMIEMIFTIVTCNPPPEAQKGEPTYFKRRNPEDGTIEELHNLEQAFNYIRMLDGEGYPPAFFETEHLRIEFTRASLKQNEVLANVRITKKIRHEQ
jgi:methionyl-tRNA formyltransferase